MHDSHDHSDHGHADHGHVHQPVDYATWITGQRADKDDFFSHSPHSPIPPGERPSFAGLSYFEVDESLRFAPIELGPAPAGADTAIQVQTSDGAVREGRRAGIFSFVVGGVEQHLTALQLSGSGGDGLFVPFIDATSGPETYPAGRYLDLDRGPDGRYDLDFNLAYAPFCAYSPHYSCPLPPPENRLSVPITAGERNL